jgi:hypothetical protein
VAGHGDSLRRAVGVEQLESNRKPFTNSPLIFRYKMYVDPPPIKFCIYSTQLVYFLHILRRPLPISSDWLEYVFVGYFS